MNINIEEITDAIKRATGITVFPDPPQIKLQAEIIMQMSKIFIGAGGRQDIYKNPNWADAYCLYFFPVNVIRACNLFADVAEENMDLISKIYALAESRGEKISFWDVGCGPATSSFAFVQTFPELADKTNFILIDANKSMLDRAAKILKAKNIFYVSQNFGCNIDEIIKEHGKPNIISMSNLLTEIVNPDITAYTNTGAELIFMMEPASISNSRKLLSIRDKIVETEKEKFHIIYPCTTQNKCPALADAKNWCHQTAKWERPEWIRLLDKQLGFNKTELDYTPIVLSSLAETRRTDDKTLRIVSDISKRKWGNELFICGANGLQKVCSKVKRLKRGLIITEEELQAKRKDF